MPGRKLLVRLLCAAALLPLAACQTSFDEFRQSLSDIKMPSFSGGEPPAEEAVLSMDGIHTCPQVNIVPDLGMLHEFTDMEQPSDTTLVSAATMEVERTSCVYSPEHGSVAVQMTLAFSSRLGPRSKIYKGDKPNFAYPYFLAVTNPEDEIVAKEVFAASMSFPADQGAMEYRETLRQIVPLEQITDGPDYAILIGFQLSDDQLAYNRALQDAPPPEPVVTPWKPQGAATNIQPIEPAPASPPKQVSVPPIAPAGFATPPTPAPAKPVSPQASRDPIGASLRNEARVQSTAPVPVNEPDVQPPSSGLEPVAAPPETPAERVEMAPPAPAPAPEPEELKKPETSPETAKPAVIDLTEPAL